MSKRWWIPAALLLFLFVPFLSCKKSEGNKITNFFGAPPQVSEVSLTKERKRSDCQIFSGSCELDCKPGTMNPFHLEIDFITATAKVIDPTGPSDILVVVLKFLDPPQSAVPPGTQISQINLEMFDSGPKTLATVSTAEDPPRSVSVVSGDLIEGDGIFTRQFYFGTTTSTNAPCSEIDDLDTLQHTFSTYSTSRDISPTATLPFQFTVEAVDNGGNIANSTEFPLPIQGTLREPGTPVTGVPCGAAHCPGSPCLKTCGFNCTAFCCGCESPVP